MDRKQSSTQKKVQKPPAREGVCGFSGCVRNCTQRVPLEVASIRWSHEAGRPGILGCGTLGAWRIVLLAPNHPLSVLPFYDLGGFPFNALKVKLLARDLRTAQLCIPPLDPLSCPKGVDRSDPLVSQHKRVVIENTVRENYRPRFLGPHV